MRRKVANPPRSKAFESALLTMSRLKGDHEVPVAELEREMDTVLGRRRADDVDGDDPNERRH